MKIVSQFMCLNFLVFLLSIPFLFLNFVTKFGKTMKQQNDSVLMNRNVVEFVTVAAEYCAFLEQAEQRSRRDFVGVALKILPLLYIKASLLDKIEMSEDSDLETLVTEEDYNVIRITVASILGEQDDYLDVFVEDMKYSERPILKTISEDLADIYQDLRNFVAIFKMGLESTMHDSLAAVQQNFELYWGQTLVNTMRALHDVYYNQHTGEDDDPLTE